MAACQDKNEAKFSGSFSLVTPVETIPWYRTERAKKNVLSYKEQSLGWFILLILVVIYLWMPVTHTWLSTTLQEFLSGCLSWTHNSLLTSSWFPNVQRFPGHASLAALVVCSYRPFQNVEKFGAWATLSVSQDLHFLTLKHWKLYQLASNIPFGPEILWQHTFEDILLSRKNYLSFCL